MLCISVMLYERNVEICIFRWKGMNVQMNKVAKKLLKTIAITVVLMYAGVTMFQQEMAYDKYDKEIDKYVNLIEQEELKKEQLMNTKAKISSKEYVEEIAREKLGLVMPNEIVFVDANL